MGTLKPMIVYSPVREEIRRLAEVGISSRLSIRVGVMSVVSVVSVVSVMSC